MCAPPAQDDKGRISGAEPPKQPCIVCALLPLFLIECFSAGTARPILPLSADADQVRARDDRN